jgi:hypothetical protein
MPKLPPNVPCALTNLLSVHVDIEALLRGACRQPVLGVLVVEGPRWDDGEECERGAGKTNIEGHADVLCEVADEEGYDL